MKQHLITYTITVIIFTSLCLAQEHITPINSANQQKPAIQWKRYGERITIKKKATLATLMKNPRRFKDKEILIQGTISEVCKDKGCWMVVEDREKHIRVEFKNYKFFIPWDSEGKKVKAQGVLTTQTINKEAIEQLTMKHPAVKKENIKAEQTTTILVATGVEIFGGGEIGTEQQKIIEEEKEHEEHKHD